ncbi:hypothetical protein Q0Z83_107530 [Actinoplanes sichuanensis]|nr:hypothetical protein Q0Z83_107530 [Actinoplanes sichuanensis]
MTRARRNGAGRNNTRRKASGRAPGGPRPARPRPTATTALLIERNLPGGIPTGRHLPRTDRSSRHLTGRSLPRRHTNRTLTGRRITRTLATPSRRDLPGREGPGRRRAG